MPALGASDLRFINPYSCARQSDATSTLNVAGPLPVSIVSVETGSGLGGGCGSPAQAAPAQHNSKTGKRNTERMAPLAFPEAAILHQVSRSAISAREW